MDKLIEQRAKELMDSLMLIKIPKKFGGLAIDRALDFFEARQRSSGSRHESLELKPFGKV